MHNIKTRQSRKDIKAFDKTADLSRRLQNTYIRTKDQAEHPEQGDYVSEAAEKVQDTAKGVGHKANRVAGWAGKKVIRKIRASRAGSAETETNDDTNTPGFKTKGEDGTNQKAAGSGTSTRNGHITGIQNNAAIQTERPVTAAESAAPNKASSTGGRTISHVDTRRSVSSVSRQISSVEKSGKGTIKTAPHTIKTAERSAERASKAVGQKVKSAEKAAKHSAQAVKRARQAAKTVKTSARFTVKAAKITVKTAAAIVRGILALVGIGGPTLILLIIVVIAAALIASPFGILFSGDNKNSGVQSVSSVVQQVNAEFNQKIADIEQSNPHDSVKMQYVGSSDNTHIENWPDVLAVFAVKTATNSQNRMDVATIDATRAGLLKNVFWDMNRINYHVDMETITASSASSDVASSTGSSSVSQAALQRVLTITITSKTADQQAGDYGFTTDQKNMVKQLLSSDCRERLLKLLE